MGSRARFQLAQGRRRYERAENVCGRWYGPSPVERSTAPVQTLSPARREEVEAQLHELVDDAGIGLDEQLRIEAAIAAAHAGGLPEPR